MFRDITWKQAVMEQVLLLVNEKGTADFALRELREREETLRRAFPNNRYVPDKVRQILQYLRDDGLIIFHEPGHYSLNLAAPDVETVGPVALPAGREVPPRRVSRAAIRLRDTMLALAMKRLYLYRCQVCRDTVPLRQVDYVESHHLHPLGDPHNGPDTAGNILVLCPNHHVMFDRGAAAVEPQRLRLVHARPGIFAPGLRLYLAAGHILAAAHLEYHFRRIFLACDS